MKTNPNQSQFTQSTEQPSTRHAQPKDPAERIPPQRIEGPVRYPTYETGPSRMYTEEEVSEMLRVSLSQLRKWRMKQNPRGAQGPPFKKIGRMVRYPAKALEAYMEAE